MTEPFLYIYQYFAGHRKIFFTVFIGLFLITGFFALKLKPEEDISKILPKDRQSKKMNDVLQNTRFADKLVVMISLNDSNHIAPDTLTAFSDSFSSRLLSSYPSLIHELQNRVNDSLFPALIQLVTDHLPVFLEPADYKAIDSLQNVQLVKEKLSADLHTLSSPAGFAMKSFITRDPLAIGAAAFKKIRLLQYDDNFDLYDGHVISKGNRYMLLFISPAFGPENTGKNIRLLKGIDELIADLRQHDFPGVHADYFGGVAVAAGNAAQLKKDSIVTLCITSLFLLVFIGWYFKKKRAPVLILLPVLLGALFSLSTVYFIKGSISVIALGAGSIVLGIAINYSLHIYNHFRYQQDMRTVIKDLAFPLTIGGLTSIGGFLCLLFVQSEILKDLGLFAAFSLIGASLSSLIFLPQLISKPPSGNASSDYADRGRWIQRIATYHPENNKWLVVIIFILTIFFSFFIKRVGFDQDVMHMNYMPRKLKEAENTLNQLNAYSLRSVFVITDGKNLNEALKKQASVNKKIEILQEKNIVKKYSGIFNILISDSLQKKRIADWNQYWSANKKNILLHNLIQAGGSLGFNPAAFDPFIHTLTTDFQPLNATQTDILRNGFANDYIITKPNQVSLVSLLKVEPDDKKFIYKTFATDPAITVIDKQYLTTKLIGMVSSDFSQIGWMVSILVFLVLLITYGRIELTLVAFIPMIIAFVWILGIMGLAGIQFNIVNIILSALIFGLGDDYSLFIMDGLLQEYKTGKKNLSSYKSSIVLSAITTLAGLGVLIFAKHPALRSIALISITGILSVVLIAQVLIPFFFNFLIRHRVSRNFYPWTFFGLLKSIFSLTYFAVGSIFVTLIGYILVKWNPFAKSRTRLLYHRILSAYTWSVIYIMGNVKKKIINPTGENFSVPSVMIANHQSFLDILVMTMLHPKVILLTNHWVWNSQIFGKLVRIAGYYPVANGIENSIDYLETQVKAGFSIAVFPEGTRSPDEQMKRFHKGAFFIAEKLALDILPVIIQGTGYTMTKGDFLLKDGFISIEYLPRIKATDHSYGITYTERARTIGKYFRQEYARLKSACETPGFFREKLFYNYIYKGPVLEWYTRFKVRLEKDYQLFHDLLPKQGRILDIGCGYGLMSYMLQFSAPGRDVTGFDYDEDKIAVANYNFSRNERIRFVEKDISTMEILPADAIILSDSLHYLLPVEQNQLMQQCMRALQPGGILLIRDADMDLKQRHRGTRLTEFFSTRFFIFNKAKNHLHFVSGKSIRAIAERNQMVCRSVDHTKYTSNLLFIIHHRGSVYEKI